MAEFFGVDPDAVLRAIELQQLDELARDNQAKAERIATAKQEQAKSTLVGSAWKALKHAILLFLSPVTARIDQIFSSGRPFVNMVQGYFAIFQDWFGKTRLGEWINLRVSATYDSVLPVYQRIATRVSSWVTWSVPGIEHIDMQSPAALEATEADNPKTALMERLFQAFMPTMGHQAEKPDGGEKTKMTEMLAEQILGRFRLHSGADQPDVQRRRRQC